MTLETIKQVVFKIINKNPYLINHLGHIWYKKLIIEYENKTNTKVEHGRSSSIKRAARSVRKDLEIQGRDYKGVQRHIAAFSSRGKSPTHN